MNEITEVTQTNTDGPLGPFAELVEILDEQGNPTGQYRPREAAQTKATFVAEDHADRVVM